jgi:hypothetical protein
MTTVLYSGCKVIYRRESEPAPLGSWSGLPPRRQSFVDSPNSIYDASLEYTEIGSIVKLPPAEALDLDNEIRGNEYPNTNPVISGIITISGIPG